MTERNFFMALKYLEDVKTFLLNLSAQSAEENDERNHACAELIVADAMFRACRGELCGKCGKYKKVRRGACDGCKWKL